MGEILAAVIGAAAAALIPLGAWFSRRATKEGRLLLRVERLGVAFAPMPDSKERTTFEGHYRKAIDELNDWLDSERRARRSAVRFISVTSYVLGLVLVLSVYRFLPQDNTVATTLFGVAVGFIVAIISFGSTYLIERAAVKKQTRKEAEERFAAIRRGERPDAGSTP